jgi:hypothetical protein
MTERKKLEEANKAFKESIEKEIKDVKGDVNKIGRSALIGGALALAVLGISTLVSSEEDKEQGKKPKKKKYKKPIKLAKDGVLLNTLKEEVLLIGLSFAAQKLSEFIKELKEEKGE